MYPDSHREHDDGRQENGSVPFDTIFRVLSNENRRLVLQYFQTNTRATASFDDLAQHVTGANPSVQDEERVSIALYHWILPTLEEAGFIEYDVRTETVRYVGHPRLEFVLDCVKRFAATR